MPDYDLPAFDFESREAMIQLRKQELARAVAEMVRTGQMPGPQGQMVSGRYVPTSWTQHLSRLVKPVMQRQNIDAVQGVLENEINTYNAADRKSALAHVASRPQDTPERMGPVDEVNPNELTAKPANPRDVAAWAQRGLAIPSRKAVLTKLLEDQEVQAPIREQASAEKRLDRLAYGQRPAKAQYKQITGADGQVYKVNLDTGAVDRLEVGGVDVNGKPLTVHVKPDAGQFAPVKDAQGQIRVLDKRTGNLRDPVGPIKAAGASGSGKPLSDRARSELDAADAQAQGMDVATAQLKGSSGKGTGYLPGLVQEYLPGGASLAGQLRDKSTKDAIQQLTYWTDEIRHGRFGSALTKVEKESASQYLPSPYDDKAELIRKAEGLQRLFELSHRLLKAQGQRAAASGASAPQSSASGVTVRRVK